MYTHTKCTPILLSFPMYVCLFKFVIKITSNYMNFQYAVACDIYVSTHCTSTHIHYFPTKQPIFSYITALCNFKSILFLSLVTLIIALLFPNIVWTMSPQNVNTRSAFRGNVQYIYNIIHNIICLGGVCIYINIFIHIKVVLSNIIR